MRMLTRLALPCTAAVHSSGAQQRCRGGAEERCRGGAGAQGAALDDGTARTLRAACCLRQQRAVLRALCGKRAGGCFCSVRAQLCSKCRSHARGAHTSVVLTWSWCCHACAAMRVLTCVRCCHESGADAHAVRWPGGASAARVPRYMQDKPRDKTGHAPCTLEPTDCAGSVHGLRTLDVRQQLSRSPRTALSQSTDLTLGGASSTALRAAQRATDARGRVRDAGATVSEVASGWDRGLRSVAQGGVPG